MAKAENHALEHLTHLTPSPSPTVQGDSLYLSDAVWTKLLRALEVLSGALGKGVLGEAWPVSDSLSPFIQYGIVLDAGSSRTTVYVYQWPAEKENDTGVVTQTCKCSVRGEASVRLGAPREARRGPMPFEAWRGPEKLPGLGVRKI